MCVTGGLPEKSAVFVFECFYGGLNFVNFVLKSQCSHICVMPMQTMQNMYK